MILSHLILLFCFLKCVCFFRNGRTRNYGKVMAAESASEPMKIQKVILIQGLCF